MTAFIKIASFTKNLVDGKINFATDTFKVMLTNAVPGTPAIKGDLTEITAANGYPAGGTASAMSTSTATGVAKVTGVDVVFTATGAGFGPFRYAWLYDDTQTSPAKPLVGYYDYGSSISTPGGAHFTVDFDGTNGILTVT